jgi:hypothetical protein
MNRSRWVTRVLSLERVTPRCDFFLCEVFFFLLDLRFLVAMEIVLSLVIHELVCTKMMKDSYKNNDSRKPPQSDEEDRVNLVA